jgi:two-component system, OmpR family, KDP operon response regulator KdpE
VTDDGLQDPLRILLVEDEPANRVLLRAVLARAGDEAIRSANLREAGTLAEAREALVDQKPELVVLDMRLPDGNGLDLAREVMEGGPGRPAVLILSASVLAPERDAAVAAGADAFLGKPYVPADLLRAIKGLLAGRER